MAPGAEQTVLKLLRHSYGQAAAVAVPGSEAAGGFLGRFPAGVDEVIAHAAAPGPDAVEWFFLVGGPGNGKSRAVQELAARLGLELPETAADRPTSRTLPVAWPAEVFTAANGAEYAFVNDASIERPPAGPGALGGLAADLQDALDAVGHGRHLVLFANVNRGVLVEERADHFHAAPPLVQQLLAFLSEPHAASPPQAPYYGALDLSVRGRRVRAHAISLDVTSLLEPPPGGGAALAFGPGSAQAEPYATVGELHEPGGAGERRYAAAGELLEQVVAEPAWDGCGDCPSKALCPFQANAAWLRDHDLSLHYLDLLRAAEATSGWRLTYRELLAEFANAVLGGVEASWTEGAGPCAWVHARAEAGNLPDLLALAAHRTYAAVFGGPVLGAAQAPGAPQLAGVEPWLRSTGAGRSPRVHAACAALRPSRDTSAWLLDGQEDLKHAAMQSVEVMSVDAAAAPAAWLATRSVVPVAAHSEIEARLDRELCKALADLYNQSDLPDSSLPTALLKVRLHLLLSQAGLATGRFHRRGEVLEFLRAQQALLNRQRVAPRVTQGLVNLLAGSGQVSLLSPRASTAPPTPGAVHVAVEVDAVQPHLWAEGDQMMVRLYPEDPGMPISFDLLREMLVAPDPDAGFTDIPEIQLARVERARARLVSRAQARRLRLEVTLPDGRRFRLNPSANQQQLRIQEQQR